jgi:MarR family transcriptional regulator, organic hydroperoxide resistance regulator
MVKTKKETHTAPVLAVLRHWREAVPNDRLAHLIRDTFRGVSRSLQTRLAQHCVSFGHWTFLRILWEHDGLTQRELSDEAGVMEPTTFAALRAMEQLGYVTREKLPDNRKSISVKLTPAGRKLKNVLVPLAEEVNEIAVRGVSEADIFTTRNTLLAIIQNLAQDELDLAERQLRVPSTRGLGSIIKEARSASEEMLTKKHRARRRRP